MIRRYASRSPRRRNERGQMEDRLRLGRNLPTGCYRSLTRTALQLETTRRRVETDPQTRPLGGGPERHPRAAPGQATAPSGFSSCNRSRSGWPRHRWSSPDRRNNYSFMAGSRVLPKTRS